MAVCVPTKPHNNNDHEFTLARGILHLEVVQARKFPLEEKIGIFDEWHRRSLAFLRKGQGRDEYLDEFLRALECAIVPLGSSLLEEAWKKAKADPPPEANLFEDPPYKALTGLCYHLQLMQGAEPFFLSCRDAASLLGIDHVRASRILRGLQRRGIIEMVQRGGFGTGASEYRYCSLKPTGALAQ